MNSPALGTRWWRDAPRLISEVDWSSTTRRTRYRFGDVILDIDCNYGPLSEELQITYGDCAVDSAGDADRVFCSVRTAGQLVALRFEMAATVAHLCAIASTVTRHRADLQHFIIRPHDETEWQIIANLQNEDEPLLASDAHVALFNPTVEPPEFLINFVVAVVQLAQDATIFVHAGGVSVDGRGTLIVGRSGQGKSTTTAALAARGHVLFGDETVGIRSATGEMLPFRRAIKLRPGTRSARVAARLARRPFGTRKDAAGLDCAWVRPTEMFPETASRSSAPLTDIFFLRQFAEAPAVQAFKPKLPEHLEDLQALTMSLSAIASWPLSPAHRALRFARIADVFSRCNCYFLDLGGPDESAELIERTVLANAQRA
jgi:hypothetical protein